MRVKTKSKPESTRRVCISGTPCAVAWMLRDTGIIFKAAVNAGPNTVLTLHAGDIPLLSAFLAEHPEVEARFAKGLK